MGQSTGMAWAEAIDRNVVLRVERIVAAIRNRIRCAPDDEVATHARGDLHRLTGAVDGVLRLHAPTDAGCAGRVRRSGAVGTGGSDDAAPAVDDVGRVRRCAPSPELSTP